MSGNLMDSAASLEMHARRRTARQFRNFNDPLRGQPVPPERSLRRRRRSGSPTNSARLPRRIFEVTPGVPESFSLDQIVDHENLALVWQAMKGHSGWAPGSDRMTFDVSPSQYMGVLRNLSRAIRCREYLPAETRTVRIPKISGGWRTLEIPTLLDRVTGLALVMALRPVLRNRFPRHYGSSSSCHAILARMTVLAETLNWHYLAVDDIRDFYPSIPRALAMDSFMRIADQWGIPGLTLRQQGIPWLIRQLIYGHEGESREFGLSQGSTFSPLAAAITLSEVLDVVIDNQIENRAVLHRYVDNIHIQGPDDSEVRDAMNATMTILNENSMSLKGNGRTIIDLHNPDGQCILGVIPTASAHSGQHWQYGLRF